MEQQLKFFEHEQFGKVRVVVIDDEPWFVAADVCRALALGNTSQALTKLDEDEKKSIVLSADMPTNGVTNTLISNEGINGATFGWVENRVNIVNEPGLYRLIFTNRKPDAKNFQRWVYHEVLPAIRKTGSYSLVVNPEKVVNPNRRAGQLKNAGVYAALMDNNTVKIGQTCDIAKRLSNLQTQYKLKVVEYHYTPLMTREVARAIEKACHEIFSPLKVDGEFFCVEFSAACRLIDSFVKFSVTVTTSKIAVVAINQIVAEKFD